MLLLCTLRKHHQEPTEQINELRYTYKRADWNLYAETLNRELRPILADLIRTAEEIEVGTQTII